MVKNRRMARDAEDALREDGRDETANERADRNWTSHAGASRHADRHPGAVGIPARRGVPAGHSPSSIRCRSACIWSSSVSPPWRRSSPSQQYVTERSRGRRSRRDRWRAMIVARRRDRRGPRTGRPAADSAPAGRRCSHREEPRQHGRLHGPATLDQPFQLRSARSFAVPVARPRAVRPRHPGHASIFTDAQGSPMEPDWRNGSIETVRFATLI